MKHVVLHVRAPKGEFVTVDAKGTVSYRPDGKGRRIVLGKFKRKAHLFYFVKNGAVYEADRAGMLGKKAAKKPAKKKPAKKAAKKSAKKKPAKKSAKRPAKKPARGRSGGAVIPNGRRVKILRVTDKTSYFKPGQYGIVRGSTTVGGMHVVDREGTNADGERAYVVGKTSTSGAVWFTSSGIKPTAKRAAKKGRALGYAKSPTVVQLEGVPLSKCKNWKTSKTSDCGGRMFKRGRTTLCEACLNRAKRGGR